MELGQQQINAVWLVFGIFLLIIVVVQLLTRFGRNRLYRKPFDLWFLLFMIQCLCIGAFAFSIGSALQKTMLGVPIRINGFYTPYLMGGASGAVVGYLFYKLKLQNRALKEAAERTRRSEKKYRKLFDLLPSGAELIDKEGIIRNSSQGSLMMTGYRKEEFVGGNILDYIHKDDRKNLLGVGYCFRKLSSNREVRLRCKSGEYRTLLVSSALIEIEGEELMLCVNTDITRLRESEREKKLLALRMEHSQRLEAIGNLAGGIAHDFNNILSPILGYCELLSLDMRDDCSEKEKIGEILKAAQRGRELTSQILQFSRQSSPEKVLTDLRLVSNEVIKLSRAAIPAEINLRAEIEKGDHLIQAAPSQIHQVCMNLITNAYHAITPRKGTITLGLRSLRCPEACAEADSEADSEACSEACPTELTLPAGAYEQLRISDTGTGIPPEIRDKIMEPYFTTKEKGKGTGMGLSIVYGIIKELGGEMKIYSEVGSGTDVFLYIPAHDNKTETKNEEDPVAMESGNEHVLVVDDEQMISFLLKEMLEKSGYTVTAFNDGMEALEAYRSQPELYDLVITDHSMPVISGMDLAVKIRAIDPNQKIILCTGYNEGNNGIADEKAAVDDILFKPFKFQELSGQIRRVLDR